VYKLQSWCRENKYDLNAGNCKYISFSRASKPVMFQYVIGNSDLERVDVINDLGVLVDSRMTFVDHIGSIVLKSAGLLGYIKRILKDFNDPYKTLYVVFVQPGLEYASCVCGHPIKRFIWRGVIAFNTTL
jgi:nucleoside-triphosphatase THEP1